MCNPKTTLTHPTNLVKDGAGLLETVRREGARGREAGSVFGDASIEPLEAFAVSFRAVCVPGSHLSGDAFTGELVGGPEQVAFLEGSEQVESLLSSY